MDSVEELVKWPKSWYLVGLSEEFDSTLKSVVLGTKRILITRDSQGKVHAMNAYCSHMGADLSFGTFDGQVIRCPMHGWAYNLQGECTDVPECLTVPRFAKQQKYPVAEMHGVVCVFDGIASEPDFPLPFFDGEDPKDFLAGAPLYFESEAPWFWAAANGFDARHFIVVHKRKSLTAPVKSQTHADMLKVDYQFSIEGRTWFDHMLVKFLGPQANLSFTTWRGNIILAEASYNKKAKNLILIFVTPLSEMKCKMEIICFQRRKQGLGPISAIATACLLRLRRFLTYKFFIEENKSLKHLGRTPVILTPEDGMLRHFFIWLKGFSSEVQSAKPID